MPILAKEIVYGEIKPNTVLSAQSNVQQAEKLVWPAFLVWVLGSRV